MRGRAIYDFQGDSEQNEVSFAAGDEVEIFRQDIGEGWWEGEVNGKVGLFPETYVEVIDGDLDGSDWDDEDDGEDWDEGGYDDEPDSGYPAQPQQQQQQQYQPQSTGSYTSAQHQGAATTDKYGKATLKRTMNRFSAFVKAGAEAFMMGITKDSTVDSRNVLHVEETASGCRWANSGPSYGRLTVAKAGTRSKFKGMKSYEAYNVAGGTPDGSVERRHKHFVWLHERLHEKYSCLCVPPLPDKQYMAKYGETFVEKRQQKLEVWLNRVARHPVIGKDNLSLRHFVTCPTSDTKGWKLGKRKAEKDEFTSATFFKLISQDVECPRGSDKEIEQFELFVKDMSKAVKKVQDVAIAHASRMSGGFKSEYKKVGSAFNQLGTCFSANVPTADAGTPTPLPYFNRLFDIMVTDSVRLSTAIVKMSITMDDIGDLWADQPRYDQLPLIDGMKEYQGMLQQFGDAITSSKMATHKTIEIDENEEAKPEEQTAVKARADIIHTLTMCESDHFHTQRREDFREYCTNYLDAQMAFYQKIVEKLQAARAEFDTLGY